MRLVGGLVVLLMFAVAVHATTYGWIDRNRPNVALERALILGRQELGVDQEQFYCVGAHLSGDREGDGQNGAWTVYYASNDGARKILTVTMAAEVSLHNWNGPIDTRENSETPSNLDDIKRRISDILDSHKLGPHEFKQFGKDSVELRYKTREFSVHQLRDDGSYSENSQKMVGPTRKGICIHVSIVETPSRWQGKSLLTLLAPNAFVLRELLRGRQHNER